MQEKCEEKLSHEDLMAEISSVRLLCQEQPQNDSNFFKLGILLYEKNDYNNAIIALRKAIEIQPKQLNYYHHLADNYLKLDFVERAINTYELSLFIDKNDFYALFNLGVINYKRGQLDVAKSYFKELWQLNNDNLAAKRYLFQVQYELGEFAELQELSEIALSNTNANGEDWHQYGLALYKNNQFKKALDAYQQALKLGINTSSLYGNLANCYNKLGLNMQCEESFNYGLQLDATNTSLMFNYGEYLMLQNNLKRASELFQQVIKIDNEDSEAWFYLAKTLISSQPTTAQQCLDRVKARFHNFDYYRTAAVVADSLNQFDKSIKFRQQAQLKEPADYDNNLQLALYYITKNQTSNVWESLKRCNAIAKKDISVWEDMTSYFNYQKMSKELIFCLDKLIEINPNNEYAWIMMLNLALDNNNPLDAVQFFKRITNKNYVQPEIIISLIDQLIEIKNFDQANQLFGYLISAAIHSRHIIYALIRRLKMIDSLADFVLNITIKVDFSESDDLILIKLSQALLVKGYKNEATKLIEILMRQFPNSLLALGATTDFNLINEEYSKALNSINNSVEYMGGSNFHWVLLAQVFIANQDLKSALIYLKRVNLTNDFNYWLQLAKINLAQAEYEQAEKNLITATDLGHNHKILFQFALLNLAQNDIPKALQCITETIKLEGYWHNYWDLKAQILVILKLPAQAKWAYLRAISLSKSFPTIKTKYIEQYLSLSVK